LLAIAQTRQASGDVPERSPATATAAETGTGALRPLHAAKFTPAAGRGLILSCERGAPI